MVVYCLESPDLPVDVRPMDVALNETQPFSVVESEGLPGIPAHWLAEVLCRKQAWIGEGNSTATGATAQSP